MTRTPTPLRRTAEGQDDGSAGGGERSSGRGVLRAVLAVAAVAALAYVLARRAGDSTRAPSVLEGRERTDDVASGEARGAPAAEPPESRGDEAEPEDGQSADAIADRAEADAGDEPPEPGEMAVDEDVENVVDEGADEETEGDESDEESA